MNDTETKSRELWKALAADPDPILGDPDAAPTWRRMPLWAQTAAADAMPRTPERRYTVGLLARTTSIDPLRDAATGDLFFEVDEKARTLNVSRGGLCLRCRRPPWVGSRVLVKLLLNEDERPIEFTGHVRWTGVDFVPGSHGGRPVAVVGIQLLDGEPHALERYEGALASFAAMAADSVAAPKALG
ncbi:MAG: PilZ domain-containing protein [Myxococcota bacterium]